MVTAIRQNWPQDENQHSDDHSRQTDSARLGILKIQRTCVHDGPGIRTTIFFRGCGLRCLWCQNPEALAFDSDATPGTDYSIDDIADIVGRDRDYYGETGGGVTLSGGEPLLQSPAALIPLLERMRAMAIPVAVETSLHVPWQHIERVAPGVDLFLIDLKVVGDNAAHRRFTRQHDRLIRENILRLVSQGAHVRFRTVIVPGHNDRPRHLRAAAEFVRSVGHHEIELLKYHDMYVDKARRMGLECSELSITNDQAVAAARKAVKTFASHGVRAHCLDLDAARHHAEFPARVTDIQNAIRADGYNFCFEVAFLKTEFYKQNGFSQPTPIHRARRLAYVLERKTVTIWPDELVVGNFTSKRRGAQVWEEYSGALFGTILHKLNRQQPVSFRCSREDRIRFYREVLPFWLKHGLVRKAYRSLADFRLAFARISDMSTGFNNNLSGIAHFVVNYERMLQLGTSGIIREIEAAKKQHSENNQEFYDGAIIALRALETFARRYADELERLSDAEADPVRRSELEQMAAVCRRVPARPARTYREAIQAMMFLHIALCIESYENAVSPGRLDQILNPYYEHDKAAGVITYEQARELLALFILKLDEAILANDGNTYMRIGRLFETMSTDQTVTAGGLGKDGKDATNDLTYALLDICELQPYSVNMTARIHPGSPPEYLNRLAEVYINGAPMPALYNDEIYVDTLQRHYDTTAEDARNYAIIGCVEPNASDDHYGNTDCANMNVTLPLLQALKGDERDLWNLDHADQLEKIATKFMEHHFRDGGEKARWVFDRYQRARAAYKNARAPRLDPPKDMDELLDRFQTRLNVLATAILSDHQRIEKLLREQFTVPLSSSLSRHCVETGKDLNEGGARFNSSGIQAVGITDAADSLHALDQVVFRSRQFTLDKVIDAIDHDFVGGDRPRIREALMAVPKFGEDHSTEAVRWVNKTLEIYNNALKQVPNCPRDGIYAAGYYALNVNDVYGKRTPSLPSGRLAGVPLANSVAPHYGMPAADLLSSLNSVAGVDFAEYAPNGTTVTFTIDAALFQGPAGVRNLAAIFRTFFQKGGMQFQPNVISREILLDAYDHPERYPFLLVRVAGYCAYFNHLSDDLKKIIINRTCYG